MSDLGQQDDRIIRAIAEEIEKKQCILFLGAGVHFPPPEESPWTYAPEERPPLGGAFSQELAEKCEFLKKFPNDSPKNLMRVAQYYEIQWKRNKLVDEVRDAVFTGKKPSPVVRALAALPFSIIVTTNYDTLFEDALRMHGKRPSVSIYNKQPGQPADDYPGATPTPDEPFVIKIHGDIQKPESIIITEEDYIDFVLRMTERGMSDPVPMTFRYLFKKWTTLFVGYSLIDYNLRLLFATLHWKMDPVDVPDIYSLDLYPDPLIMYMMQDKSRKVSFIEEDVWKFIPQLYKMIKGEEMP